MKLRRLTLQGFKSFADRTELRFEDGITAIVGPNGCGKSNISDAIRWVLGEQRASAIRGNKMEEAIFQGTLERRALNRAEVAMTFDNERGRLPLPQKEVEIRRTVFREGGSDYQLNKQSVRLRDIFDICRDTGLGANAYTVIEQGMVDSILSDRPDERRHLFEEAAGIGRYKDRRKAAQRKLEGAENDLSRLEDLVGEVETKVRSLVRQRNKAERYGELRARRLALEVTVATAELAAVRATLERTAAELEGLTKDDPGRKGELTAAEAELERRRLESADAGRRRNEAAQRLETLALQIAELERNMAVAEERRSHAERRLEQIAIERDELTGRAGGIEAELAELQVERAGQEGVVRSLSQRVLEVQERQGALRQEVTDVRRADEEARARENEITRRLARLEADAAAADARGKEAAARLEHLADEAAELDAELARLAEQGDLFTEQARTLAEGAEALRAARRAAVVALEEAREAELVARRSLGTAEDEVTRLKGRVSSMEALEREHAGFAPAVAAALNSRGELDGLLGPVAEFLKLPAERAAAVEGALGSLLQALVVRNRKTSAAVKQWLREHEETGAVALLPEDALPRLEALVEALEFVGEPAQEAQLIGRREKLEALRTELLAAEKAVSDRAAERDTAHEATAAAEAAQRAAVESLESAEAELRRAESDEQSRAGQRGRVERARAELDRRKAELEQMGEGARADAARAREERQTLEEELTAHRAGWQHATEQLAEREAVWEEVRDEEAELRVGHARAEGALTALDRRIAAGQQDLEQARQRAAALEKEEAEHRQTLQEVEGVRSGGTGDLEELFARRDTLSAEVRELDEGLQEAADAALKLEARVRALRRSGEERSEQRHKLELERAEAAAHETRVQERLEVEWGRPFQQLVEQVEPLAGEPAALKAELTQVAADIERLGPINMLAAEEHAEESERLEFLTAQRDDLTSARQDLEKAIREINRTANELFMETFHGVRTHFQSTFQTLFEGGQCDVVLEDPEDPLESPIEITASPRGKRTQRIHMLSGGERALTALALLFAIYLVKPSPFCVLDEVDAPLDESNVGRFVAMLERFKPSTQFVVITHNPRTMEAADWLYGVTMEEPGISTIVGVQLEEVLRDVAVGAS